MENKKNIIGEVSVEVKAGLSVDERTFRTCMDLVAIHAQNKGIKGMVTRFNDQGFDRCSIRLLTTEEELDAALYSRPDMLKENGSED